MSEQKLADRLDSFAEGWRPKPGDKLIGLVTDLDTRETEYGDEPYPIITVQAEEGSTQEREPIHAGTELAWHAFHTIARREIAKQRPAIGDHIGIAYHGPAEKAPAGFSPAERWRVIVDERSTGAESSEPEGEGDNIPF